MGTALRDFADLRVRGRADADESDRRAEIRSRAASVFADLGYANATMRDVATATGILPGSLYYHFPSKEQILLEVMLPFTDDIVHDMEVVLDQEDVLQRITALLELALAYVVERTDEARILANDARYIGRTPVLRPIRVGEQKARKIWIGELRRGVADGVLRPDLDPKMAYATLMGTVYSALRWYRPRGAADAGRFTDHVARQLLHGIVVVRP